MFVSWAMLRKQREPMPPVGIHDHAVLALRSDVCASARMDGSHRIGARSDDRRVPRIERDLQARSLADDRTVAQIQAEQVYIRTPSLYGEIRAHFEADGDLVRPPCAAAPSLCVLRDARVRRSRESFRPI